MKNLILLSLMAFATIFISSCGDPCENLDCGFGMCDDGTCLCPEGFSGTNCEITPCTGVDCGVGECVGGICECPVGYEGDACEIESRTIYYGTYLLSSSMCPDNFSLNSEGLTISEGPGDVASVTVTISDGTTDFSIDGFIIDGFLDAGGTVDGFLILADGDFSEDGNRLEGEVSVVGTVTCQTIWIR